MLTQIIALVYWHQYDLLGKLPSQDINDKRFKPFTRLGQPWDYHDDQDIDRCTCCCFVAGVCQWYSCLVAAAAAADVTFTVIITMLNFICLYSSIIVWLYFMQQEDGMGCVVVIEVV